jgi:hypothetical protein
MSNAATRLVGATRFDPVTASVSEIPGG